ncbi:MAG: SRPBCC family protein, partial [Nitrospira sp.]
MIDRGPEKYWDAEIVEQTPDRRIAWKDVGGAMNKGIVTFEPLSDAKSLVQLSVEYEPEGVLETVGNETGAVSLRVKKDLERFKEFIEL